jgi:Ca-activated chloride channel family protein
LLLLLLPPLLAWLKGRRGDSPAFVYSAVRLAEGLAGRRASRAGAWLAALRWVSLFCFIFALAQPRLVKSHTSIKASGIDIVVALDLSGSMAAEDFELPLGRLNRLEMAKRVLKDFVAKRSNDRIGLVSFATEAYIVSPLTLDHDFLQRNLDRLQLGTIDNSRTAIGSGLSTAVNRVRDLEAKSRIVILMTDGQNNAGKIEPLTAAEAAAALKVKVYTVGVGTRGTAPVPVFWGGRKVGYRQERVDIDEETLTKIAELTGGTYYRADNARKFGEIYDQIDKLEKSEAEIKKFAQYRELFAWFVVPGFGLLMLELVLANTVFRKLP